MSIQMPAMASPRKRASSKTQQNFHPMAPTPMAEFSASADDPVSNKIAVTEEETKIKPPGPDVSNQPPVPIAPPPLKPQQSSSLLAKPPIKLRKPLPEKQATTTTAKAAAKTVLSSRSATPPSSASSAASCSSSSCVPKLKKHVHVVKLISPDQPNEYLKVLNIPTFPDTLKIGRQNTPKTSNKITDGFFDSRVLSRNHAELFIKDNLLYIRDLKSSNGTFINDKKLEPYKDYNLLINDKIDLGTTLESQMAHKKITCIIKEFDFLTLKNFQNLVSDINNKDDLIVKKMKLFNNTFDALLFGEIVDDIVITDVQDNDEVKNNKNDDDNDDDEGDDLLNLINSGPHQQEKNATAIATAPGKFVSNLDIKSSSTPQEMVKKLIVAVNNEYIQQQRLKEMNTFLQNYNNSIAGYENTTIFKMYDNLLKKDSTALPIEKHSLVANNHNHNNNTQNNNNNTQNNNNIHKNDNLKYTKMEDQLRKTIAELDQVRRHLSTAKSKEVEMQAIENGLKTEIVVLQDKLKQCENTTAEQESLVVSLREKIQELEKSVVNNKDVSVSSSVLQTVSSTLVKYSGVVVISVVILYCMDPLSCLSRLWH